MVVAVWVLAKVLYYMTEAVLRAGNNRNGPRDATMVLLAYRHGLRPVELVTLRWDAIDFAHGQIHVSRAKNGAPSVHPLSGLELRALRRLKREQEPLSSFLFTSERGSPFTTAGWRKMVARLGEAAKLGFKTHPHMLRHACGFQLANQGTDTRTLQAHTLAIATSSTRRATRSCRPRASRTFGATDGTGRSGWPL
jgi:integrase